MKLEMPSSRSPANTNRFFKIILSDTDLQTKLMIPRKFVRKYGNNLDSRISLKAPNGLVWQVKLERREDQVWLQDGWPEFTRFYSIQFGHLLVFKYEGHCDFQVRIFDPSSMEIDYPSSRSAKSNIGESSQVRKRSIETDHLTSSDHQIRPCKKRVKNIALCRDASHNGVCLMRKLHQGKRDCASAIEEAKARALASAEAFKSDNPFFIKPMKISHVDRKSRGLVVRKSFEESYKKWKDNDQVHLQVAGNIWLVDCNMKWNMCRLSIGWDRFAQDNSLTVGDVCVFELIAACRKLLRVVIFRAIKETDGDSGFAIEESKSKVLAPTISDDVVKFRKKRRVTSLCLKSCHKKPNLQQERANANRELASKVEKDKALARAQAFKSENPFFILTMKPYLIDGKGRPCVPKTFKEAHENWKHNDKIILQVAGRTTPFYCTLRWDVCGCRISPGWSVFARDNLLNVGDVCVFELIVPPRKLFQVSIFRAKDEAEETRVSTPSKAVIS